jgi:hypothetical protein
VRGFSLSARDPDRARVVLAGGGAGEAEERDAGGRGAGAPDLRDWSGFSWAQEDRFVGWRVVDRARFRTGW